MNKEIEKLRFNTISRMREGVDVLIIGGGITGSGVLNILSSTNIKVALVDAYDFAFGTSSRSSKLIHGGLRYIANGQFSVVRESVKERDFLLQHSNLVRKENFIIPIDDNSWSKNTLRFGLWIYSLFSKEIKAKWYSMDEVSHMYSALADTPQQGGYIYAEGVVNDARLVIENILSSKMKSALALNYAEVLSIDFQNDSAASAKIKDKITGIEFQIPFKILINSAGPWVGNIFKMIEQHYSDLEDIAKLLKLSKGDHIIVKRDIFPVDVAIALRSPIDGRQVFIIPRGEVIIIGTTETEYNGDINSPLPREVEIQYLLNSVKAYLKNISRSDVINAYSGLRPLFGRGGNLGKISREYRIIKKGNVISIVGGKITTYREIAIRIAKLVLKDLGVHGNPSIDFRYSKKLDQARKNIIRTYGIEHEDQMSFAYDILYEDAIHADDILWRREGYFIFSSDSGTSQLESCIETLKHVIGLSDKEAEIEGRNYLNMIHR